MVLKLSDFLKPQVANAFKTHILLAVGSRTQAHLDNNHIHVYASYNRIWLSLDKDVKRNKLTVLSNTTLYNVYNIRVGVLVLKV